MVLQKLVDLTNSQNVNLNNQTSPNFREGKNYQSLWLCSNSGEVNKKLSNYKKGSLTASFFIFLFFLFLHKYSNTDIGIFLFCAKLNIELSIFVFIYILNLFINIAVMLSKIEASSKIQIQEQQICSYQSLT